jgi:hypothetical protein
LTEQLISQRLHQHSRRARDVRHETSGEAQVTYDEATRTCPLSN